MKIATNINRPELHVSRSSRSRGITVCQKGPHAPSREIRLNYEEAVLIADAVIDLVESRDE